MKLPSILYGLGIIFIFASIIVMVMTGITGIPLIVSFFGILHGFIAIEVGENLIKLSS